MTQLKEESIIKKLNIALCHYINSVDLVNVVVNRFIAFAEPKLVRMLAMWQISNVYFLLIEVTAQYKSQADEQVTCSNQMHCGSLQHLCNFSCVWPILSLIAALCDVEPRLRLTKTKCTEVKTILV